MSIPSDANFKSLSCQLGGLRLNGIVNYSNQSPSINSGTAQSLNMITIDDPAAAQTLSKSITGKFLQVTIGSAGSPGDNIYYIPLYK
jgi:hypothetical protein